MRVESALGSVFQVLGSVIKLSCTQVLIIGIKSIQQPTQSDYTKDTTNALVFRMRS